jgi:hypothetical protein
MTTLEKAARAHYERLHYTRWETLTPSTRDGFLAAMRAAIETLRPDPRSAEKPGLEAAMLSSMVDAILSEKA